MAMSFSPNSGAESPGGHSDVGTGQGDESEPPGNGSLLSRLGLISHEFREVGVSKQESESNSFSSNGSSTDMDMPEPNSIHQRAMNPQRIHLMLIEDNPGDVFLTRDIIEQMRLNCDLTVVEDGEKALQMLRRAERGSGGNQSLPDLVLLDLNLPRKTGREVLADIRDDPHLAHLPVVVLTSSGHTDDMAAMLGHGASSYMLKPMGRTDMMHALDLIASRRDEPV